MEGPYDNANRGSLPPDRHSLTYNEYTIRRPPYGPGFEKSKHLHSYIGDTDYVKNIVVDERENPYTGTNYAWVRARCLGGKTNIWGRLSLRLSDYDFKAKNRDGYGENWPISYSDIAPYYDKVELLVGVYGSNDGLENTPDSAPGCLLPPPKRQAMEVIYALARRIASRPPTIFGRWGSSSMSC